MQVQRLDDPCKTAAQAIAAAAAVRERRKQWLVPVVQAPVMAPSVFDLAHTFPELDGRVDGHFPPSIGVDDPRGPVTVLQIQKAVCRHARQTLADMRSPARTKDKVVPRHIAMMLCGVLLPNVSLPQMGRKFGGRDHTTGLNARQKLAPVAIEIEPHKDLPLRELVAMAFEAYERIQPKSRWREKIKAAV